MVQWPVHVYATVNRFLEQHMIMMMTLSDNDDDNVDKDNYKDYDDDADKL